MHNVKLIVAAFALTVAACSGPVSTDNDQHGPDEPTTYASEPLVVVCINKHNYASCSAPGIEDGVCVDGWCHCYADAQCNERDVARFIYACIGGVCVPGY